MKFHGVDAFGDFLAETNRKGLWQREQEVYFDHGSKSHGTVILRSSCETYGMVIERANSFEIKPDGLIDLYPPYDDQWRIDVGAEIVTADGSEQSLYSYEIGEELLNHEASAPFYQFNTLEIRT